MDANTFKENGNPLLLTNLLGLESNKIAPISRHKLQKAGLDKNTPVALIENGCCPDQYVITGTLENLKSCY